MGKVSGAEVHSRGSARCGDSFQLSRTLTSEKEQQQPKRISFKKHQRLRGRNVAEKSLAEKISRHFQDLGKANTPWRKAFGEPPAKEDLQYDSCRPHACICKKPLATQDLHHRISEQDLCSLHQVHKRSPGKISVRGLLARSQQISMQCLYTRPQKPLLSSPALCTRSPQEVSWQDPCTRSL